MVEQADARECHRHLKAVAGVDHVIISNRAARLGDILHTAAVRALNIVAKREERIRAKRNAIERFQPRLPLLAGERLRLHSEELLPYAIR